LDGKGNSSLAPIDFLGDTMEGYNAFRKIERDYEPQSKANRRTPEEEQLFNKLAQDTTIKLSSLTLLRPPNIEKCPLFTRINIVKLNNPDS
jgi:hypothetical protein